MHWRKHPGASADVYTHSCTEHETVYPDRPHKNMRNCDLIVAYVHGRFSLEKRLGQDEIFTCATVLLAAHVKYFLDSTL